MLRSSGSLAAIVDAARFSAGCQSAGPDSTRTHVGRLDCAIVEPRLPAGPDAEPGHVEHLRRL